MRHPLLTVAVGACLLTGAARADIAPSPVQAGSGPEVLKDGRPVRAVTDVAMARETITITLHDDPAGAFATVDVTFVMKRVAGGPKRLEVAFPGDGVPTAGGVHPPLVGFRAFIDGTPIVVDAKTRETSTSAGPPGHEYKRTHREQWHAFGLAVPQKVGSETTVRVRYAVAAAPFSTVEGVPPHARVGYILHTGRAWAGSIDSADVVVTAVGVDPARISAHDGRRGPPSLVSLVGDGLPPPIAPDGAVRDATSLRFTMKNLEPDDDDDLSFVFPVRVEPSYRADEALTAAMAAAAKR